MENEMSAMGNLILEIDEQLYDVMNKRIDNAVMLDIAKDVGVPFNWVADRYKELLEDW
jgi:chorismate mutase